MKIGIGFPYESIGDDPDVFAAYVRRAEDLGFDFVTFIDHVLGAEHADREPPFEGPYTEESIFREPLTLMSWLAGQTERIELVTAILILPQRQAALVAKQAAEIQLLSRGRLRLGLGSGWNYIEYESLGVPYRNRGPRLEEQVEVMRRLWTDPVVDFTGRFHRVDRAGLRPLLGTPVPIWFGGFSPAQQDRCGRIGDGFLWQRGASSLVVAGIERVRAAAVAAGRDPDSIGHQTGAGGSAGELAEFAKRWASLGGTHMTVPVPGEGSGLIAGLETVARELGALLG